MTIKRSPERRTRRRRRGCILGGRHGSRSVAMTNEPVRITRLRENRDGVIGTNGDASFGGPTSTTSILLSDRGHT
jgi:hypothetical protein